MAWSRSFLRALVHQTLPSRFLSARGLRTKLGRSNHGLKQEKLQYAIGDKKLRNQFLEELAAIDQAESLIIDDKSKVQSNNHVGSSSTRLASPLAFNDPVYSGYILPFPDKFADALTAEMEFDPPIRFTRVESDVEYEKRVSSAKLYQENEDKSASDEQTAATGMQSQAGAGNINVRRVKTESPDPFLANIRGTSKSTPVVCENVPDIRARRREVIQNGGTVGFVPTMGALHQGHLDLMKAAAAKCTEVWVSIYVNPTQFGANEDLSTYPSTWQADLDKIEELNKSLLSAGQSRISTIFRPRTTNVLYPYGIEGTSHVIINPELTQILEGSSRPTFFRGVTTIVMKLLNIVQPDRTFFGQKDIQQLTVIKRMIKEFHLPVALECVPTTRELSGLAMSSRNAYLGQRRLGVATLLYKMLSAARRTFKSTSQDQRTRSLLIDSAMKVYEAEFDQQQKNTITNPQQAVLFKLDYLSLADPDTMQEIRDRVGPKGAIMSLAVAFQPLERDSISDTERLGINGDQTVVRLIDNELLGVDSVTPV